MKSMELNCSKLVICVLLTFVAFGGYASDSIRTEKKEDKLYIIHQVEPGETLYSLSKRYNAEIQDIASENGIIDNQLSVGQVLKIPLQTITSEKNPAKSIVHVVKTGETLYSLSRQYGVEVEHIKSLNGLSSNEISIGQELQIIGSDLPADPVIASKPEKPTVVREEPIPKKDNTREDVDDGFATYFVQSGDLIESIAKKFGVRPDSIIIWNNLTNTYLKIGQKLKIKGKANSSSSRSANAKKTAYGTIRTQTDVGGFTKVFEEGVAGRIDSSMETEKYLALHRTLPIGKMIEVRNLMNNQKVFVRIVGSLPDTGINENVLIRLTPICFERLGVIDPKTRVEVSYYRD